MNKIIILLFVTSNLFSQIIASKTSFVDTSDNNQFYVQTSGYFYEGFVGDQKVQLITNNGDTLWTKNFESSGLRLPSVSNNGTVVIGVREVLTFYDSFGDLLWEFKYDRSYETYTDMSREGIDLHDSFSNDSKLYFIFILDKTKRNNYLSCLSISEGENWSINFDYYMPTYVRTYNERIYIHDFQLASRNYLNTFYIVNFNGSIINNYSKKIGNPIQYRGIKVFDNNKTIELTFRDTTVVIK